MKLTPTTNQFNDTAAATRLLELYDEARNGLRRVVALGLFCFEIKAHIKHGEFEPWLKTHCREVGFKSLQAYMTLTKNVIEGCGFQISSALDICHRGEILLLPEAEVPTEGRELRAKICDMIDGKTHRQLLLEFRAEKQPAKHHARKPVTEAERIAAENSAAMALSSDVLVAIHTLLLLPETLAHCTRDRRRELMAAGVRLNNELRKYKA